MANENPLFSAYLERQGVKRSAVASALAVSRGYITELANGSKRPGLDLAFAIERHTGGAVPASSWIGGLPAESLNEPDLERKAS